MEKKPSCILSAKLRYGSRDPIIVATLTRCNIVDIDPNSDPALIWTGSEPLQETKRVIHVSRIFAWGLDKTPVAVFAVFSPAGDRVIDTNTTTIPDFCADRFELACRRVGLPVFVPAPAGDRVIDTNTTTMVPACADRFEHACRRVGLPALFQPQQVIVLSTRTPQLWCQPALTVLNSPVGASVSPALFQPQQVIVLSTRTPQLWCECALTVLNSPAGASASPSRSCPSR